MKSLSSSKANANRANSSSSTQRVPQPIKTITDNRPTAVAQRKLQEAIQATKQPALQLKKPGSVIQLGRSTRASTVAKRVENDQKKMFGTDHGRNTRNSKKVKEGREKYIKEVSEGRTKEELEIIFDVKKGGKSGDPIPYKKTYKKDIHGTLLWNGFDRPGWGSMEVLNAQGTPVSVKWEDEYYNSLPSQPGINGRKEYSAVTQNGLEWLPRKKDRQPGEDHTSIGHKKQWVDMARNLSPKPFQVEVGLWILAIPMDDLMTAYRDVSNLRLESQSYNSSVAKQYTKDDAPGQYWA